MGIDRIGKGGPPPPAAPASSKGAGPSERVRGPEPSRPFEVRPGERAGEAGKAAPVAAPLDVNAVSPLERLRAGQIDVNGYVDLKVEQATAHLHGLSPVELAEVKTMLRDRITSDPALADLVKQATGSTPTPREE